MCNKIVRGYCYTCVVLCLCFFSQLAFSETPEQPTTLQAIGKCREILEMSDDPTRLAETHYELGVALEKLGKKTEATSEYLKIIINYPDVEGVSKKAEERLNYLYSGFKSKLNSRPRDNAEPQQEKSPTIFFAYIKSLYINYRNTGKYDRAMNLLKKLYNMDPENESYLVDMGEIQLSGYNNVDKAIFYFTKALQVNPGDLETRIMLGKAYEKKGDYTNAIKTYNEIAKISSASQWTVYGLRRAEGIRLTREKQLIKDWFFLGPFDSTEKKGMERLFILDLEVDTKTEYPGKDGTIAKWFRPFGYDDFGYADLNTLFKSNDYVTAYALTYVYSYSSRTVQLRFGAEDGIKIWVNDKVLYESTPKASAEVDDEIAEVKLEKGWNKILLKVVDTWGSWGFYFRITGLNSKPIDDLIFDPEKDNKRLNRVYGKIKIEKRFKFTKIAAAYGVAVSILLLGLYFMITNIYYKIKVNRMKEDFISNVSHELKTPIAAIKMLAETLRRGTVRSVQKKSQYYDMIVRESDRLTRFINKILNFSTIKKGSKIFYFEKSNIVEMTKRAIHLYEDEMQDKSLKINFNTESENIFVNIDKDAFLQVILNLLDNAYKYSKNNKEITVNVKNKETEVLIEIIDKGLGIDKDEIVKIFERFYRVDSDILKGTKGSGLGLAFVRSIIESHKGKIAVTSAIDKGSKFTISLPIEKA